MFLAGAKAMACASSAMFMYRTRIKARTGIGNRGIVKGVFGKICQDLNL
jgi:hypothetical protein